MILNETYDEILERLNMYNSDDIGMVYEYYLLNETRNNKQYNDKWKKIRSRCKNAIRDSKRLANNGNYQDAIKKLEECKRNLSTDFKELCQKTDFNAIDNVLSMIKYLALPIAIVLAALSIHYGSYKYYTDEKVLKRESLKALHDLPMISIMTFSAKTNINTANQNAIKHIMETLDKFDKVVSTLLGLGCSLTVVKSLRYFSNIFRSIKSKKGDLTKMGNAGYNMANEMYNNMMASIDDLEKYYKRKMEE